MPKFDATEVVEALEWDFTAAGVKAKGTIPEPSDAAIGAFLDGIKKLYSSAQEGGLVPDLSGDLDPAQLMSALAALTGEAYVKFQADLAGLFAELCGNTPTKDQLLALPLRVRVPFFGWVQREVVSPEAEPGAGTAVVKSLASARAG